MEKGILLKKRRTKQRRTLKKVAMFHMPTPWVPGHRCAKGKEHYIEVFPEDDEEEEEEEAQLAAQEEGYQTTEEEQPTPDTRKIAALSGIPRFHTLRLKGNIQGQNFTILVGGGATHNFKMQPWWRG